MNRPYIVSFANQTDASFEVTVHSENCSDATEWTRGYFGDYRLDYRNRNVIEYLHSDFDSNHTYRVRTRVNPTAI